MNRKVLIIMATLVGVMGLNAGNASAAPDGKQSVPNNPPVSVTDIKYSYGQTKVVGVQTAVSNGTAKGKIQLRWESTTPLTKAQRASLGGCRHKAVGTKFRNSGRDRSGKRFYFWAYVKKGDTLFCGQGANTYKASCRNHTPEGPVKVPMLPSRKVQLVKFFTTTATVTLKLNKAATATANASCSTNTGSAAATAYGSGVGTAQVSARATARSSSKARTVARQRAGRNVVKMEETLKSRASGSAKVSVEANAAAVVSCTTTPPQQPPPPCCVPPPPPPPPPPPANKPPTGSLRVHARIENTPGPVCVDNVGDPEGDVVTVRNFRFTRNNAPVGQIESDVYRQPSGAWCVIYRTPSAGQVQVQVDLVDSRGATTTLVEWMPVEPD